MDNAMDLISSNLTPYQQRYWKNPEYHRQLQKNKYIRYPEKIKAYNKIWAENNSEYLKVLVKFNSQIWYYKNKKNDPVKVMLLTKAKDEFKRKYKMSSIAN